MKIVLLESLAISQELLDQYIQPLKAAGHTFESYEREDETSACRLSGRRMRIYS